MALRRLFRPQREPIYSRLPLPEPKSIRLLNILPGKRGTTIECTLEVVNLDTKPVYEALSYVWGPTHPPVTIICNKHPVEVTPNLGAALQRLRSPDTNIFTKFKKSFSSGENSKAVASRRLWIDALCINQEDLIERSQQVSFMKEIYDNAKEVIVWLGEEAKFALKAISLIQSVARIAHEDRDYTLQNYPAIPYDPKASPRDDLPPPGDKIWESLDLFYENEWFRRIWVIQEAARENGLMLIGPYEVSLLDVSLCSEWLNNKGEYALNLRRAIALLPSGCIFSLRKGAPLLTLLTMSSLMKATNSRDKIYALLGLYSMWSDMDGMGVPPFRPDYTNTVAEEYGNLVRYFIALPQNLDVEEGSLRIMLRNESFIEKEGYAAEADDTEDVSDFPSWTPRWDQCRPPWAGFSRTGCARQWRPSGDSTITTGDNNTSTVLSLKGFITSSIDFLERDFELPAPRLISDSTLISKTLTEARDRASQYLGEDLLKQAIACTLTAGKSKQKDKCEPYSRADLEAYLDHGAQNEEGLRFADEVLNQRTFFITKDGHMGLGSRKMQVGDLICVLYGGEVLFILRPIETGYELVGECYVHGLMQGEAMEKLNSGELKDQWFDLH